jgi:hypothetical protein
MVHITLFQMLNLLVLSEVRVQCPMCSSLVLCLPGMFLRYFLSELEMGPVAPVITDTIFVLQGGSDMTGTNCDLFTHNQSRSYLNHLVHSSCSVFVL